MKLNPEVHARRCTKISEQIRTVRDSNDPRKHRRWINLVTLMTRYWVKANGTSTSLPTHRHLMRKFYSARVVPGLPN